VARVAKPCEVLVVDVGDHVRPRREHVVEVAEPQHREAGDDLADLGAQVRHRTGRTDETRTGATRTRTETTRSMLSPAPPRSARRRRAKSPAAARRPRRRRTSRGGQGPRGRRARPRRTPPRPVPLLATPCRPPSRAAGG